MATTPTKASKCARIPLAEWKKKVIASAMKWCCCRCFEYAVCVLVNFEHGAAMMRGSEEGSMQNKNRWTWLRLRKTEYFYSLEKIYKNERASHTVWVECVYFVPCMYIQYSSHLHRWRYMVYIKVSAACVLGKGPRSRWKYSYSAKWNQRNITYRKYVHGVEVECVCEPIWIQSSRSFFCCSYSVAMLCFRYLYLGKIRIARFIHC